MKLWNYVVNSSFLDM